MDMKPSLAKLHKFLALEAQRGFDNGAVVGGLGRMLSPWEAEARVDGVPEEIIQAVVARLRDYDRLSPKSRAEVLQGLWRRIRRAFPEAPPLEARSPTSEPSPGDRVAEPASGGQKRPREAARPQPSRPAPSGKKTSPRVREALPGGAPVALSAPVTVIPGIGPRRARRLERLGIRTLEDLLYHFPRRYDDYAQLKPIRQLRYGEQATVLGTVERVGVRELKGGKLKVVEAFIGDGSGVIRATWFNQPWIAEQLSPGKAVALAGRIDQYLGRLVLTNPEWEELDEDLLHTGRIVPVYPLTAQITQRWLRALMAQVIPAWTPRVPDPLPPAVRQEVGLLDLSTALLQMHFPDSWEMLEAARTRLAFEEIFYLQLGVLQQKRRWQSRPGRVFTVSDAWLEEQTARLPFQLTGAQQRALAEIRRDLASGHPMNRLLQGDVGSGKTVVAALAMAMVTREGAQAALMAPTAILAEQ
ncbi:MAG TPA: DNA helicase RecG, partial [Anaerolineales bacterium]|nr:DNA helicase RecG [Anaerolineales bacterium]